MPYINVPREYLFSYFSKRDEKVGGSESLPFTSK
uniref:Uncharacterized protein n=1 Tax=Arundo donax TaxID=35708 RepID=A0A0A8Z0P2_ARUDO